MNLVCPQNRVRSVALCVKASLPVQNWAWDSDLTTGLYHLLYFDYISFRNRYLW
jgi:hypothetical protein